MKGGIVQLLHALSMLDDLAAELVPEDDPLPPKIICITANASNP